MKNSARELVMGGIVALLILAVLGYAWFETRNIRRGPVVNIEKPENGSTIESPLVTVRGNTRNISEITLNDRKIFVTEEGDFKEEIVLAPGYNIVEIEAQDRYGKSSQNQLQLFLDTADAEPRLNTARTPVGTTTASTSISN